jgi:hypothetical protein
MALLLTNKLWMITEILEVLKLEAKHVFQLPRGEG